MGLYRGYSTQQQQRQFILHFGVFIELLLMIIGSNIIYHIKRESSSMLLRIALLK